MSEPPRRPTTASAHRRRGPSRPHLAVLVGVLLLLAGCGASTGQVGGVEVEVPAGWTATDPSTTEGLVAAGAWRSNERDGMLLQVLVACDDQGADADALTVEAASRPRPPLTLIGVEDAVAVDVPGLDRARRTELTFSADGSDAASARVAGLYGTAAGRLVVAEFSAPTRSFSAALAEEILGSVRVDTSTDPCG